MKQFLFESTIGTHKWINLGWLFFRIYAGLSMALGAGLPKITANLTAPGWFIKQVGEIGFNFPSPVFWATAASWGEFLGGLLIAVGLFTRVAAIQLAVQFFVVSFIWYDEPMPIVGMYYQQLIFWGYVLISAGGAGLFSVDQYIYRKTVSLNKVRTTVVAVLIGGIFFSSTVNGQNRFTLQPEELNNFIGNWKGTLMYNDYTSGKEVNIPVLVQGRRNEKDMRACFLKFDYPGEKDHTSTEEFAINKEGTIVSGKKLIEKSILSDGSLKIVLEDHGNDGNDHKPAVFNTVIVVNSKQLTITKMVMFDEEKKFFVRNEYRLSR